MPKISSTSSNPARQAKAARSASRVAAGTRASQAATRRSLLAGEAAEAIPAIARRNRVTRKDRGRVAGEAAPTEMTLPPTTAAGQTTMCSRGARRAGRDSRMEGGRAVEAAGERLRGLTAVRSTAQHAQLGRLISSASECTALRARGSRAMRSRAMRRGLPSEHSQPLSLRRSEISADLRTVDCSAPTSQSHSHARSDGDTRNSRPRRLLSSTSNRRTLGPADPT